MAKKIALLFSGQGSQTVGMGKDLCDRYASVAALFKNADEILGRALSQIAFEGPEAELTKTENSQPALFIQGIACLTALRDEVGEFPIHAAAGLSLGEFTAHATAKTFDFETGLRLVADRARFMQEACETTTGAMAAMIGAEENVVRDLAAQTDVDIANLNSPGQIVISGEAPKVALAVSLAGEHGIRRAKMLNVAGAYHSRLMESAYVKLGELLYLTTFKPPSFPVISNIDARPVREQDEIRRSLHEQVTGTVRWTESIEYLIDEEKCDYFIELGAGTVLAGLLQRTRKGTPIVSISDTTSLAAAIVAMKTDPAPGEKM